MSYKKYANNYMKKTIKNNEISNKKTMKKQ